MPNSSMNLLNLLLNFLSVAVEGAIKSLLQCTGSHKYHVSLALNGRGGLLNTASCLTDAR